MTLREHADSLFSRLSSRLGSGEVGLDRDGTAAFTLGETAFVAGLDEDSGILAVAALIGPLPTARGRSRALRELAGANFNWGGTGGGAIGLEEDTGLAWLHRRFDLPLAQPDDFPALIAEQTQLARHWAARLEAAGNENVPAPHPSLYA